MCFKFFSNSLDRTLFYSNMTVPLCIRQGSKRNDDSVSVEELDWSAESQVLIPAEHLWCDSHEVNFIYLLRFIHHIQAE